MDTQAKAAPALTIVEAEQFWTGGEDARQDTTGADLVEPGTSESIGIDLPGVGVVDASEILPVCAGREAGGGELGERSPELVTVVHEMSLSDRLRASVKSEPRESIVITPMGVAMLEQIAALPQRRGPVAGDPEEFHSSQKEEAATREESSAAGDGTHPPVEYAPDFKLIARELLSALYTMIRVFGMPTGREASDEVHTALMHAEAAKVDEVLL